MFLFLCMEILEHGTRVDVLRNLGHLLTNLDPRVGAPISPWPLEAVSVVLQLGLFTMLVLRNRPVLLRCFPGTRLRPVYIQSV